MANDWQEDGHSLRLCERPLSTLVITRDTFE